jgi:glucan phosphoethanolaminetransferase (alkaline phosphatase superfamily)
MALVLLEILLRERALVGTMLLVYCAIFVAKLEILLLLAGTTLIMHSTRGRTEAFAAPFGVPVQMLSAALLVGSSGKVERQPVEYEAPLRPRFRKAVMVVGESVRGCYLEVNSPKFDNTPFLVNAGAAPSNYGVATSAANYSVAACLIIRFGLQKQQLLDMGKVWRRMPTVLHYAKEAGYHTALIDAWPR